jgi:mycothiol synthase
MNTITSRLYAGEADLARLIEFLSVARPADRMSDYPSAADLREMLCQAQLQANTCLWFDQHDQLIAFALIDAYNNLLLDYSARVNSPELEEAIMQWGLTCGELPLDAVCREDDVERFAWLTRHGFQPQAMRTLRFVRSLRETIPDPQLPAGLTIRSVAGESEIEALVALHRAAFGTDHMTIEERRAMMSGPDYDPALDLVAVAPDGNLAGFCVCGIAAEGNADRGEGYTDPIGVHPDFQKKGLARALLLTGLRLLRERSVDHAVLGTSSENAAMQATARSAGFQVEYSKVWFSKPA